MGQIISIEPVEQKTQSKWKGTRIQTDRYNVSYSYTVDGQDYQKTDVISVSMRSEKLIISILDGGAYDTFMVKFDENDPGKSLLVETD